MKENVERSDPVLGHVDVTPEHLDTLHAKCHGRRCEGAGRAMVARSLASTTESLQRVTTALSEVALTVGQVRPAFDEPLADWERELLAVPTREEMQAAVRRQLARYHRGTEVLQAVLQHQRINPTRQ